MAYFYDHLFGSILFAAAAVSAMTKATAAPTWRTRSVERTWCGAMAPPSRRGCTARHRAECRAARWGMRVRPSAAASAPVRTASTPHGA